jgi:hypothetical protein
MSWRKIVRAPDVLFPFQREFARIEAPRSATAALQTCFGSVVAAKKKHAADRERYAACARDLAAGW